MSRDVLHAVLYLVAAAVGVAACIGISMLVIT